MGAQAAAGGTGDVSSIRFDIALPGAIYAVAIVLPVVRAGGVGCRAAMTAVSMTGSRRQVKRCLRRAGDEALRMAACSVFTGFAGGLPGMIRS